MGALLEREHGPHLVTLGLGPDMHIASVFPEWYKKTPEAWAEAIGKSFGVLVTETRTFEVRQRISVNLRVIRKADHIMVHLPEGSEEAWKRVKRAFDDERFTERRPKQAKVARAKSMIMSEEGVMMLQASRPAKKPAAPPPVSPLDYVLKYSSVSVVQLRVDKENHLSVIVLGAAGDLAKKKTFPALFQLQLARYLPVNLSIVACDDTTFHKDVGGVEDFWEKRLRPYIEKERGCPEDIEEFRRRLEFVPFRMDDPETAANLDRHLKEQSQGRARDNRVFYLALPSFLFAKAVQNLRERCYPDSGFFRVIVEKPFGKDGKEANILSGQLTGT